MLEACNVEPLSALNVGQEDQSMYTQIYEHNTLRYSISANPDSRLTLKRYEDYFIRFGACVLHFHVPQIFKRSIHYTSLKSIQDFIQLHRQCVVVTAGSCQY